MFHILVVEDDQALNKLICRVLAKNGYETAAAFDGEEALAILDNTYIDLIITDIMMPRMDGYDLTRELRENGYQLPILVVTAKDTFPDKLKGFKLGIDDYMVKPIDVNELLLRVEALLRRSRIIFEKKTGIRPCLSRLHQSGSNHRRQLPGAPPERVPASVQAVVLSQSHLYPPADHGRTVGL